MELTMSSGIYRILCIKNGRYYYGSSKNVDRRWSIHQSKLRRGVHDNSHMQNAYDKHGEQSFRYEFIKAVPNDKLFEVENEYLNEYVGKRNCFNINKRAECPILWGEDNPSKRPEVRQKISEWHTGRKLSQETKSRISKSKKGKPNGWLGRTHSEETKSKQSVANKENPPWRGKHHSEETKKKMSLSSKGQIPWNKGLKKKEKLKCL